MQVFTPAVLPAHPVQMTFLAKNMAVHGGEDLPHQNGLQVLLIQKGKGGQVHVIERLHSCGSPHGRHLGRGFFIPAAAAITAVALGDTPACWPPYCDKVGQQG